MWISSLAHKVCVPEQRCCDDADWVIFYLRLSRFLLCGSTSFDHRGHKHSARRSCRRCPVNLWGYRRRLSSNFSSYCHHCLQRFDGMQNKLAAIPFNELHVSSSFICLPFIRYSDTKVFAKSVWYMTAKEYPTSTIYPNSVPAVLSLSFVLKNEPVGFRCSVVMPEGAVIVGFVAGFVYNASSALLLKLQVRSANKAATSSSAHGVSTTRTKQYGILQRSYVDQELE